MKNIDSKGHVTGKSIYLDDISIIKGTRFGVVFDSPIAHGTITSVDYSKALALPGVVTILTHEDIPGGNQIGGIIPDEPLFASTEVHFVGQPIALIIAESDQIAFKARKRIEIEISKKSVIVNPREAKQNDQLIFPPRTFELGDMKNSWKDCAHIFEGQADSNGQEHLYIETQGAYAIPMENGHIRISSSTQGPTSVQKTTANILGIGMNKIEVDVVRLGGGFGGKEDQATPWAVMAALGVFILNSPVKVVLSRLDDMRMTGKRHPYSSDYKIGLSNDLKIMAYETTFHQNAGASADLSPAVLERTLFHGTNSYFIPNVKMTAYSCKTNLPPNTAFRGFGGPQGMFVIESALSHAAEELGISKHELQKNNLLKNGDEFPYGQIADGVELNSIWQNMESKFHIETVEKEIQKFNSNHSNVKKGFSLMPISFGISFTKTPMNQARALVHIYTDGSVGVSTGAVEMGQGVNTKMLQIAAQTFSIDPKHIKLESTNTTRVANTSPSAASATADLNGKALEKACNALMKRLKSCAANHLNVSLVDVTLKNGLIYTNGNKTDLTWDQLVTMAFLKRICLTENGHYATPTIHFDMKKEKGHPFSYHVYGLALTEVTLDCVRGTYDFDAVKIVHDFGKTMNPSVDFGQIEGGLIQGMGWMTMEDLRYNDQGQLLSNTLSTYKIPDIYSVPKDVIIEPLETEGNEMAILKSKAVGEPPLMYGIGAYFAIENAVRAFNPNFNSTFDAPFTHEKVLMGLYGSIDFE
ncbi:MAG: molybdopterin-dependent oxidoreductase [Candidatus Marinimicrobia bacterium]|jgi:xanthine dehydrogenase large subunit|nr:molybdopterin-dependent oxidoreductase [Candidatus Neomarinimicrobiota bacterium]MBT3502504.1 molybdopterin-dependent oxidoreductase [Candidatus Neomarinimicrobiota bacterium]MBT3839199.1 molybdopterin-dependent oxidoreductase [Candidatus Neomarinimicrobiota bacterium]MBT4000444.1 molybdopterin-dependent oxidoreductase [Candidatus Neomarinimicrobiota bacterium]MBT4282794.1 molybdopterin-dependent oxidoreductase [Candidatus Neomarinimicrobiota bacterium]